MTQSNATTQNIIQQTAVDDCLFCQIVAGQKPAYTVYEDRQTLAFLDLFPISKGHTLIIPKTHSCNLLDTNPDTLRALMDTTHHLAKNYQQSLDAIGFNLKSNHGAQAHQEIMHLHFHLVPRYKNDGLDLTDQHYQAEKTKLKQVKKTITSQLSGS